MSSYDGGRTPSPAQPIRYGSSPASATPISKTAPTKVGATYLKGTCDKCDGPHLTDACPIYKKKKEDHPDAWRNFG